MYFISFTHKTPASGDNIGTTLTAKSFKGAEATMERNVNNQDIYADGSSESRNHNKNTQNKNTKNKNNKNHNSMDQQ